VATSDQHLWASFFGMAMNLQKVEKNLFCHFKQIILMTVDRIRQNWDVLMHTSVACSLLMYAKNVLMFYEFLRSICV